MKRWIQVTSGRGPVECEWVVDQVVRKIMSEASQQRIKTDLLATARGALPNTLKSAMLAVEGASDIESFLQSWSGSIQWIGKSVYRPNHKRKNWFVGADVLTPREPFDWRPDEIRIERKRSSGPGGQHVNKTESAVRITHIPTGLHVTATEERSQHANQKLALARLGKLLSRKRRSTDACFEKQCWDRHNTLERGNAVRIFEGPAFTEINKPKL